MDRMMKVWVDGKQEERKIVNYETNHDINMDVLGLAALNEPVVLARGVPELFEGERIEWGVGGACYIVKGV